MWVNNDRHFISGQTISLNSPALLYLSSKHTSLCQFFLNVFETVCRHVLLSVRVSEWGTGRRMILTVSQAHCAGSVSMALTHIHRHHISSFFLSLTQTLRNTAALLCTRAFHLHSDSKLPTYKVSAQNMLDMHENTYVHVCLCASGWAGHIVLHRKNVTASKNPTCLFTT